LDRGKLLDIFRDGFQSYNDYASCPYVAGTSENEYWWAGFAFADEMAATSLTGQKRSELPTTSTKR
jgi:predicted secreted protein